MQHGINAVTSAFAVDFTISSQGAGELLPNSIPQLNFKHWAECFHTFSPIDQFYSHMRAPPTGQEDTTLDSPLLIAQMLWANDHEQQERLRRSLERYHNTPIRYGCHDHSTTYSWSASQKSGSNSSSTATKIGTAFARCSWEMRFYVKWDRCKARLTVREEYESIVEAKLRDFGYHEDANGTFHDPKKAACTTCPHGHKTSMSSSTASKHTSAASTAKTTQSGAKKVATSINGTASTTSASPSGCSPAAKQSLSKPVASGAKSAVKPPTTAATAPKAAPLSARGRQKQQLQTHSASLLSDCRRFSNFAESNAAERTYVSPDAKLRDVIRELNRAVLRYGISTRIDMIWAEFASLVALLNYAAIFYEEYANNIEWLMNNRLGPTFVNDAFAAIYDNRAAYIETEEFRSEGCPEGERADPEKRRKRRLDIYNSYLKMNPDVTDLRDGIQTVLFTFIWINETAFKGRDPAVSATLHILIPLLETVIVRCARQTYLMQNLSVYTYTDRPLISQRHKSHDLQLDLLALSTALQNLSGGWLALFTSDTSVAHGSKSGKGVKKDAESWKESVVSCPYGLHLYTLAAADVALEMLQSLAEAIKGGRFWKEPQMQAEKKKACQCHLGDEERTMLIVKEFDMYMSLAERKQYNWMPHMRKSKKSKKGQSKSGDNKRLTLKDILDKRTADIKKMAAASTKVSKAAEDVATNGDKPAPSAGGSPNPAVETDTAASSPAPSTPKDLAASAVTTIATEEKQPLIPPSLAATLLSRLDANSEHSETMRRLIKLAQEHSQEDFQALWAGSDASEMPGLLGQTNIDDAGRETRTQEAIGRDLSDTFAKMVAEDAEVVGLVLGGVDDNRV